MKDYYPSVNYDYGNNKSSEDNHYKAYLLEIEYHLNAASKENISEEEKHEHEKIAHGLLNQMSIEREKDRKEKKKEKKERKKARKQKKIDKYVDAGVAGLAILGARYEAKHRHYHDNDSACADFII